ncbi:MAG: agmatine deiminase family protein [Wenzhouxiangella sp.]
MKKSHDLPRAFSLALLMVLSLSIGLPALAAEPTAEPRESLRLADPAVLDALRATDTPGLPRNLTPGERAHLRLPDLSRIPRQPPMAEALFTAAEYERNASILMRWGNFNSVLTEMIVPITTGDSLARVLLVVASTTQRSSASQTLAAAGANLARVDFLIAPSNSVWIRDYGPRFTSADNARIIVDHPYNRPRPQDNQVPAAVAALLDEPLFLLPLNHGGGNFHLFANGEAFMTDLIVEENDGLTAQDVKDLYASFHGLDLTLLPALPAQFDSTQHLDMWFLPVDDRTVIIGDYRNPPPGITPSTFTNTVINVTESTVALIEARGYTVLRTPGWRAQTGAHHTYTNAVIVNDQVLICRFNSFPSQNAQAQSVFELAFPEKTIIPVDCSTIINSAGALHCIVKHKPAPFFRLEAEQSSIQACIPEAGTLSSEWTLSLVGLNGYADTVSLQSELEAGGVSLAFSQPTLVSGETITWSLAVDAGAQAGVSELRLLGIDEPSAGLPLSLSLSLGPAAPAPELVSPMDLAEQVELGPVLSWSPVAAASAYRVQAALDPQFLSLLLDAETAEAELPLAFNLPGNRAIYWRVLSLSDCGAGSWGAARRFTTRALTEAENRLFDDRFQP